jgi:CheY-like chemotaxis protein
MQPVVLVVDDAEEWRTMLRLGLGTLDAKVVVAENAAAALEAVRQETVAVLVTDVGMPGMTGIELLDKLKAEGMWPARGAIVISGEEAAAVEQAARARGATFFKKPASMIEVRRAVERLLRDG